MTDIRRDVTLGLIVNPIAGMGGSVGLKGTDGSHILREARRRGARPVAAERARIALRRPELFGLFSAVVTGSGELGENAARAAGFDPIVVHSPDATPTTSADTITAALAMVTAGIDLLLFVGGDGTARDILSAVGDEVPILGVPAGVKMHSAVFATSPANAGRLASRFLAESSSVRLRAAEVMDLDEAAMRADRLSARLYGYARSPFERRFSQNAKVGSGVSSDAALVTAAQQVAAQMRPDCCYLLGPGTSTRLVSEALTLPSTLLGVDAVINGELVGLDLDEARILGAIDDRESWIIAGVLGGQGSLFGRGNQQISAEVLRRVGRDRIIVLSSAAKLAALRPSALQVDTGDDLVDTMLTGHIRVQTGFDHSMLLEVRA